MIPLLRMPARDVVDLLRTRQVTPLQLIDAVEHQIAATDGLVNAVPTRCYDRAHARAQAIMQRPNFDDMPRGYLYGLPIAVKDLTAVEGVRFTQGSRLHEHDVARYSDPLVVALERNGAIVIGKTNTPEFGAGAQTFNDVFGATRNPWNPRLTAGGSSGGSAAALAAGQVWLATGTDLGGSLRIPAAFCGVVGLRPSPGLVPQQPAAEPPCSRYKDTDHGRLISVNGPMARNVADLALCLDAMTLTLDGDGAGRGMTFTECVERGVHAMPQPLRVAWSADLGVSPVQQEVRRICENAVHWFENIGVTVENSCPAFNNARPTFQVLRAIGFKHMAHLLDEPYRSQIKPELVWQIEKAVSITAEQLARAEQDQDSMMESVESFFERYDVLCTPCVMSQPFDVETRWLTEVEGVAFDNYIDWLMMTYVISLTNLPAISVPCGFDSQGMPVGLQMVGRRNGDRELLAIAAAFETAHDFASAVPLPLETIQSFQR